MKIFLSVVGIIGSTWLSVGCTSINVPKERLAPEEDDLSSAAVSQETVIEGLVRPWGMAWLPNGDILITERGGQLRIVRSGALDPKPIEGVKPVSKVEADQLFATKQGGLLDVSVHPRFAENSWIYLTYAHGNDDANHTQVA